MRAPQPFVAVRRCRGPGWPQRNPGAGAALVASVPGFRVACVHLVRAHGGGGGPL